MNAERVGQVLGWLLMIVLSALILSAGVLGVVAIWQVIL